MKVESGTLSNGIRLVHQQDPHSAIAHIGLFINVGSREETSSERGIAHFLEHALFKGTKRRKAYHILSRLDVVGGELNAYTTKEETVVYASVLNHHLERAAEIIADISFNSTFPEKELIKEKEVVVDEIASYKDAPSELIFEDFDRMLYGNHPLGNDILGSEAEVLAITKDKIQQFVAQHYRPQNMVIAVVGNVKLSALLKLLEKYFGSFSKGGVVTQRIAPKGVHQFSEVLVRNNHQSHMVIGSEACPYSHDDKTGLILLNNYLGGPGLNSRLNMEVREKLGLAYHIESSVHNYQDSGVFAVYFASDKRNLNRTRKIVLKELDKLCNVALSPLKLHQAKEQLKGFIALGLESNSGLMLGLGKSFLMSDSVESIEESLAKIDNLTSNHLLEIANKYVSPNKMSKLTYMNQ